MQMASHNIVYSVFHWLPNTHHNL